MATDVSLLELHSVSTKFPKRPFGSSGADAFYEDLNALIDDALTRFGIGHPDTAVGSITSISHAITRPGIYLEAKLQPLYTKPTRIILHMHDDGTAEISVIATLTAKLLKTAWNQTPATSIFKQLIELGEFELWLEKRGKRRLQLPLQSAEASAAISSSKEPMTMSYRFLSTKYANVLVWTPEVYVLLAMLLADNCARRPTRLQMAACLDDTARAIQTLTGALLKAGGKARLLSEAPRSDGSHQSAIQPPSTAQPPLKLRIEMIPSSAWGVNLRSKMSRTQWERMTREVHTRNGNKCEICGSTARLNCHEEWSYDDQTHTLRLERLGTVCGMCHHVAHFGRSLQLHEDGYLDISTVIEHALRVNRCTREEFDAHIADAGRIHTRRSQFKWTVDFGPFTALTNSSPRKSIAAT